ncbi:MAG: phosphoglucosamine mutase [Methanimicrococcus sp.]|nr:phosphoglucosamine mutase [Methanimicrococcus sp.]
MALFGTNGVRGVANVELTPEMALDLARSLSTFLLNKNGTPPKIIIGTDTRISGHMLKNAAVSGLLSCGASVMDIGVVPTPALQFYVKKHRDADAGIIVTASHNPREYNGIKMIAEDGTELSRDDEKAIEDIYFSKKFGIADWTKTGCLLRDDNCNEMYIAGILEAVDKKAIEKKSFKIVTDTGNGAGSFVLPDLASRLSCRVLSIGADPNGMFPWRNPEPLPEVLTEMSAVIRHSKADLGIAQDGDADRAVFMDENGDFIDGEVILAAIGKYILQKEKGPIVTTVATSRRFADVAEDAKAPIYFTPVGSIDVGRKMVEVNAVYGGEGNGGMIFARHQICRDGAMAAAIVLEMLAKTGMKASELKKTVPNYFNEKTKIKLKSPDAKKAMAEITKKMIRDKKEIGYQSAETVDGLKLNFNNGWMLIRPSGTEPIIRVAAEAKTKADAEKYVKIGQKYVDEANGS